VNVDFSFGLLAPELEGLKVLDLVYLGLFFLLHNKLNVPVYFHEAILKGLNMQDSF
jgi:hypothetical protein